ncbi:hypothetical protein FH972_006191 [Carpinus fangiana]|uniref:PGG domain-containing protein n=1 Tax=Carpinus fangiana TaxID=176857 RepID=A0A5N6QRI6_9ROSI|nr:hypothetical protein FH972_006191 [Carpinus fangiana]
MEIIRVDNELSQMASKGEWDEVVNIYRNIPEAHKAIINRSGDTVLHSAVSDGKEEIVEQLITEITSRQGGGKKALEIKNNQGNTPLHVAVSMGNTRMCECIAQAYPSLMFVGDANSQTPIFLALQGGKHVQDIFLKLLNAAEGDTSWKDIAEESIRNVLFHMARTDKWDEVVNIYKWTPLAHKAKITKSGDTALHIAVSQGNEEIVEQLVGSEGKEALKIKNEQGNTALHVAASMGSVGMCRCIAQVDKSLVGVRNEDGETPFFVAAAHGKKEAFLCLLEMCGRKDTCEGYSRRNDGKTILHVAVAGDYFDLAFQIIQLYPGQVNFFNEDGFTPLHLLASNPSNFKSASNLGLYASIIYHCIFVGQLQVDPKIKDASSDQPANDEHIPKCLESIFTTTCIDTIPDDIYSNELFCLVFTGSDQVTNGARARQLFPLNYVTCFEFLKLLFKPVLFVLGLGSAQMIRQIVDMKQKHRWSIQILKNLVKSDPSYQYMYSNTGTTPSPESESQADEFGRLFSSGEGREGEDENEEGEDETTISIAAKNGATKLAKGIQEYFPVDIQHKNSENKNIIRLTMQNSENKNIIRLMMQKKKQQHESSRGKGIRKVVETPILIAAKNGITEIVEKILEHLPFAIDDVNTEKKNIVLLAVENRQSHIYKFLLEKKNLRDSVFQAVDNEGNSALHLAAKLGDYKPWLIPGAALQMQWEVKWYEFVKNSKGPHFFGRYNNLHKTPEELFAESHKQLVKDGGKWLNETSKSCSVIAALIATVAFATSTEFPGGVREKTGTPMLVEHPAFSVSAISSAVALCLSVTALVMFLAILTSRYEERDFGRGLPKKLLLGLTSLFLSIASVLVSFCAGDYFVLKDNLKRAVFPVYAAMCVPITIYAVAQVRLYLDLVWGAFKTVPKRRDKALLL